MDAVVGNVKFLVDCQYLLALQILPLHLIEEECVRAGADIVQNRFRGDRTAFALQELGDSRGRKSGADICRDVGYDALQHVYVADGVELDLVFELHGIEEVVEVLAAGVFFIDRPEDVSKVEVFMAVSELQSKTKGLAISCSLDSSGKFLVMVEIDVLADAHTLTRHARKYVENIADALFEAEISLLELSRRKELA